MNNLSSHYIRTFTGLKFHPFNPQPDQICIEDISHALSRTCRYSGHCPVFYSVAEHCLEVSSTLPPRYRFAGLLHDASEAYLCDIPKPLKLGMPEYQEIERNVEYAIAEKFNLECPHNEIVKEADNAVLQSEFARFFPDYFAEDFGGVQGYAFPEKRYLGLFPEIANLEFLTAFISLINQQIANP